MFQTTNNGQRTQTEYDYHRRPHPGHLGGVLNRGRDGEWNPGSSKLVGVRHTSSQPPQVNAYLASQGLTTTSSITQGNQNGYGNGYNNPINRNVLMNTFQEHQQNQLEARLNEIEKVFQSMTLEGYSTRAFNRPLQLFQQPRPPPKVYANPPMFNIEELERTRKDLVNEFTYFTHLQNKAFYRPMDKIIDYVDRDPNVEAFSRIRPPPLPLDMDLKRFDYVKANSLIQMNHLRLFNRPRRELPPKYRPAFRRAVQHVSELMKLDHKLPMPTEDSLANVKYDGSKFAGLDYARQKLKSRKEAHDTAMGDAKLVWHALLQGRPVPPHDARLGGKGKLIERSTNHGRVALDNDDVSMGRLILMLSHRDLLILGALEQPLTASYLDARWPIYIGQSWYYGGSEKFVNKMARHAIYHCFDAKKFDAAIDGYLVQEALLILRQQYEDGMNPKYDTLWSFVYESLVEVVVCRDDGIRMQKHVGTTSGNCFNTLVQSIITMFLGYTALIVRAEERMGLVGINNILVQCEIEVLGDDMVLALAQAWMFLTRESLAEVVKDCFNIDWSGKKSFTTRYLTDDTSTTSEGDRFKGVQFLGTYFRHQRFGETKYAPKVVVPYRPFRESYLSLLFPKHGDFSYEHSWLRAVGIYMNAAGNHETREWLEAYLDFLELVPFVRPTAWPPGMEKMVIKDFWNIGKEEVPLPERISVDKWMRIACIPRDKSEDDI